MVDEKTLEKKPWYQSKTLWMGVASVAVAAYNAVAQNFGTPAIPEWIFAILGAVGVYGRSTATTTLTK